MQYCNALNWNFKQPEIPYNSFPRRPIFLPSPKRINSAKTHPSQYTPWVLSNIKQNNFISIASLVKSSIIQDLVISPKSPLNTLHFARKILIFLPLNRQRHSTPNNPRLNPENLDLKRTNVVLEIPQVNILSELPNSKNINQTNTKTLNADLIHILNQEEKSSKFNIKIKDLDGKTKMARVITNSNHPIQQENQSTFIRTKDYSKKKLSILNQNSARQVEPPARVEANNFSIEVTHEEQKTFIRRKNYTNQKVTKLNYSPVFCQSFLKISSPLSVKGC